MKFLKIIFFIPFFMLASCETITDWTESIIPGDDEFVEEGNDNQQLLSDESRDERSFIGRDTCRIYERR